ncbi:hypothetical protein X975_12897, partial [Stegodyphus mimosarum]
MSAKLASMDLSISSSILVLRAVKSSLISFTSHHVPTFLDEMNTKLHDG